MPRTPRVFITGKVYEICFRTEEGLPLVCTPYMEVILRGILAQAFSSYEITCLSLIVMGNHVHMHVLVHNPEHVDDMVCYIKRESSHAINNLLGRRRHTVWQESYDAAPILDVNKMIERLGYVFLNPARAELEVSIEAYPGLNSWKSLTESKTVFKGRRIPREVIQAIPESPMSFSEQRAFADALLEEALPEQEIEIDPLSFLDAFPEGKNLSREKVRQMIISRVKDEEARLAREREKPVLGAHALRLASIRATHAPTKFGKKMWCLGSTREIRMPFINWLKEQFAERLKLKAELPLATYLQNLPAGFFAPGGYLRANLNPAFVPF